MRVKDKVGNRYGKLTVVSFAGVKENRSQWLCKCDCGNEKIVWGYSLHGKNTFSCGCFRKEQIRTRRKSKIRNDYHGKCDIPEYQIWAQFRQRCSNPKNSAYRDYGERGITVCERWNKFVNFFEDMGERPSPKHSLDRINNNLGYFKENCRWTTWEQQNRNKRDVRLYDYQGEKLTMGEIAKIVNVNKCTILARLKVGRSMLEALYSPVDTKKSRKPKNFTQ